REQGRGVRAAVAVKGDDMQVRRALLPCGQYGARLGHVAGHRPAHPYGVGHRLLGDVVAVGEHQVLQRLPGEPALAELLADLGEGITGTRLALGTHRADDPREAGDRLGGVDQPVAVVGVLQVVAAALRRQVRRPESAGLYRVAVVAPRAVGPGTVQGCPRGDGAAGQSAWTGTSRSGRGSGPAAGRRTVPVASRTASGRATTSAPEMKG